MLIDQLPELNSLNDTDEVPVERGTTSYKAKISTWLSTLAGSFVRKIGDTMTGNLTVDKSAPKITLKNQYTRGTHPSSTQTTIIEVDDSAGNAMGTLHHRYTTTGVSDWTISARNINQNNETIDHNFRVRATEAGESIIEMSSPAAWLSALNGGMEYTATTADIATAASGCQITTAQYEQWGKVAQLRLVITKTEAVSSGTTTLATLVTGKRPKMNTSAQMGWGTGTNGAVIGASGAVQVIGAITAGQNITITATYMLA